MDNIIHELQCVLKKFFQVTRALPGHTWALASLKVALQKMEARGLNTFCTRCKTNYTGIL